MSRPTMFIFVQLVSGWRPWQLKPRTCAFKSTPTDAPRERHGRSGNRFQQKLRSVMRMSAVLCAWCQYEAFLTRPGPEGDIPRKIVGQNPPERGRHLMRRQCAPRDCAQSGGGAALSIVLWVSDIVPRFRGYNLRTN